MRSQTSLIIRLLPAMDSLLLALVLAAVWVPLPQSYGLYLVLVLSIVPCWILLLGFFDVYKSNRVEGTTGLIRKILSVQVTGAVTIATLLWALGQSGRIS